MRRYSVRKPQPSLQCLEVVLAEFLYRLIALGTTGDGEYRQYYYVGQQVLAPAFYSWVVQPCCCFI